MRTISLFLVSFAFLHLNGLRAQTGCPGCQILLPEGLAEDTVFLSDAAPGQAGVYYNHDLSFRLPKTTTPVNSVDPTVPAGLTISHLSIASVANLPPGLQWEASETEFDPAEETDGCVKLCGAPLQPGIYQVEVFIAAQVLFISQTTSFSFEMVIAPSETVTEGFSMVNGAGCGELQVAFTNLIPSQGMPGYAYQWNFGNGFTSVDENPFPQTYTTPGEYPVSFQAVVDTSGYFLVGVTVDEVGCNDIFNGRPDLKIQVFDQDGGVLYTSDIVEDADVPLLYTLTLPLGEGNYSLQVVDDDGGINGADDNCGIVNFTKNTSGQLLDAEMAVTLNILHPVDTVRSNDTVRVFAQPDPPLISYALEGPLCDGDTLLLSSSFNEHNQWYRDSSAIFEGTDSMLTVAQSGTYQVTYTSPEGCISISEEVVIHFGEKIEGIVFVSEDNLLSLFDTTALPDQAGLEWLLDGEVIAGASDPQYCIGQTGTYTLVVTDLTTGCQGSYSRTITYNPNFPNCMTPVRDLPPGISDFTVSPNPFSDEVEIRFRSEKTEQMKLKLSAADGKILQAGSYPVFAGDNTIRIQSGEIPDGLYWLILEWDGYTAARPVVKR